MNTYLQRYGWPGPEIKESPIPDLMIVVVIPAFNERDIITVLQDLQECDPTRGGVEILLLINHAENADAHITAVNDTAFNIATDWIAQHQSDRLRFHVIYKKDLPAKKAGVGLARKIGMDEAVRRYEQVQNPNGIIVCLDADCRVDKNYLDAIEQFFNQQPKIEGCSIHFEHILEGLDADHCKAIIDYELHLRYFIGMQRWAGYPFAYQTVGSAMAVRVDVYCKVGGMNMRQAGEDFYFLHKVIERGAFAKLNTTTVMPSPRISDRVPFGTGRSMLNQLGKGEVLLTYHPAIFHELKHFIQLIPLFYATSRQNTEHILGHLLPTSMRTFLQSVEFMSKLNEISEHTATLAAFQKRFFRWFNAFMLMKYVHFARDNFYASISVYVAAREFASLMQFDTVTIRSSEELLVQLRLLDRLARQ